MLLKKMKLKWNLNKTKTDEQNRTTMPLNPPKAIGPNVIPTTILKLLINDVSSPLTQLFNLSTFPCYFPINNKNYLFIKTF